MIKELSKNIMDEVYKKLDEIYNHRKAEQGLVSCHNSLINSLKRDINNWYKKQISWENNYNQKREKDDNNK